MAKTKNPQISPVGALLTLFEHRAVKTSLKKLHPISGVLQAKPVEGSN